jgi:hypothetical protein
VAVHVGAVREAEGVVDELAGADGNGDDENKEQEEEEEKEEARIPMPLRDPKAPSAADRAVHKATHLPFCSWRRECVAGRRDNPVHKAAKDNEEQAVPDGAMDYCSVRREDEESTLSRF